MISSDSKAVSVSTGLPGPPSGQVFLWYFPSVIKFLAENLEVIDFIIIHFQQTFDTHEHDKVSLVHFASVGMWPRLPNGLRLMKTTELSSSYIIMLLAI